MDANSLCNLESLIELNLLSLNLRVKITFKYILALLKKFKKKLSNYELLYCFHLNRIKRKSNSNFKQF